jgi:hypothetical protein
VTIVKTELSGLVFPNHEQHGFTWLESMPSLSSHRFNRLCRSKRAHCTKSVQ